MGKNELIRRYVLFTMALCVSSLSIALVTKGLLGTTPISSIPYVFSLFTRPRLGQYTTHFFLPWFKCLDRWIQPVTATATTPPTATADYPLIVTTYHTKSQQ